MKRFILICVTMVITVAYVSAQTDWKLNTEKDGIKVYTSEVHDSKIKAIRVECEVDATPAQLVALIMDVSSSTEWVYHTKSCVLLKRVSPSEIYYYSEVNLPWPASNRDFVAHLTASQNPVTKVVTIDGPAVPDMVPVKKGIVRVNNSTGKWIITPSSYNRVKVEYTLHTEPGGKLPAWIVNMFATEGPMQVFENLRQEVQKPAYKNAQFQFTDEKNYAAN